MEGFRWVLDRSKVLSEEEVNKLLEMARKRAEIAKRKGNKVAVRDYFVIDLALSTGLRVMEIANLNCGDIYLNPGLSFLVVRRGKCGKKRIVWFNGRLKQHIEEYLSWKREAGEETGDDAPLILSSNTKKHMTTRALQKAFKRCLKKAGLPEHFSFHSLRHTYGTHLYRASNHNLRLVQEQLGHSSIKTTEVYAGLMREDISEALERLYR